MEIEMLTYKHANADGSKINVFYAGRKFGMIIPTDGGFVFRTSSTPYTYGDVFATVNEVKRTLARARAAWIRGNPYYERVEGVVAGTPSLARYDVILGNLRLRQASGQLKPEDLLALNALLAK